MNGLSRTRDNVTVASPQEPAVTSSTLALDRCLRCPPPVSQTPALDRVPIVAGPSVPGTSLPAIDNAFATDGRRVSQPPNVGVGFAKWVLRHPERLGPSGPR